MIRILEKDPIVVVIATSKGRTNLLYERSLRSVYTQVDAHPKEIVIVDDNHKHPGEFEHITECIERLRTEVFKRYVKKEIPLDDIFKTTLLKNKRTKGHSGTGAWNTALYYLEKKYEDLRGFFITILDDDDSYHNAYLSRCSEIIKKKGEQLAAIFPYLEWVKSDGNVVHDFSHIDLTQKAFLIGNPGIQGSNMCIRGDLFMEIRGFDEKLHSATDRDLMIRFLDHLDLKSELDIEIIPEPMVLHHTDRKDRVTEDKNKKKLGLDVFYNKYRTRFSKKDMEISLERAERLFGYECNK